MAIQVGDLVRISGKEWLGARVGIVTEVRELVHDQTSTEYRAVTALVGGEYYTFGEESFDLLQAAQRRKK